MKTLILVRHGHTAVTQPGKTDFDRPLNDIGIREAETLGRIYKDRQVHPDLIVSSSAARAWQTARIIAGFLDFNNDEIIPEPEFYEAGLNEMSAYCRHLAIDEKTVIIVGHNPVISELARWLCHQPVPAFAPCNAATLTFEIEQWRELNKGSGSLTFFDFPELG